MNTLSKKSIAILLGIVFFAGGVFMVGAQESMDSIGAEMAGSSIVADTDPATVTATASTGMTEDALLSGAKASCGWRSMTECVALVPVYFTYYLLYKPASILLIAAGLIFDFTLTLSIDSSFIDQGPEGFVNKSWTIIRDFSNMVFIFILLYTGISTMLGMGNWRKTVIQVVIVALLINFSLFFTKVVIDAGNVLAVKMYTTMQPLPSPGERGHIGDAIVGAFRPQAFISAAASNTALDAIMIFVIAAVVNIAAAYALFKVALVFIGRILAFWFLMIISPFAFISTTLPKGNKFNWWLDTLLSQTFVAPIFLFALYLIMQLINSKIFDNLVGTDGGLGPSASGFITEAIIAPILIATLLVVAILKAKDLAEGMAGEFGKLGAGIGSAVLGVATGGTAMLGRKVVGGAAAAALKSGKLQGLAQGGSNRFTRGLGAIGTIAADRAQKGSWDARNIGGKGPIGSLVGKGVGSLGLGKGTGEGGYQKAKGAADKAADEKARARAELFDIPPEEKARIKREAEAAEAEAADKETKAREAHEASATAQEVRAAEEVVKATQKVAEEAVKKIAETQAAYDAGYTGSGSAQDLKLVQELHDAKGAAEVATSEFTKKEAELTAAVAKHAASQTAVNLKMATDAVAIAKRVGAEAISKMNTKSTDRREVHAKQAESKGRYDTAKKIRSAEKIGEKSIDDRIKEEVEKKLKEQGTTSSESGAH